MEVFVIAGIFVGGLAFLAEMLCDRRLKCARRVLVGFLFGIAGFVVGVGAIACYLFHDGTLPDDARLSGWAAVVSYAIAFFRGTAPIAAVFAAAGLMLRRFPRVGNR